jgi:hypothetical protein
VNTAYSVGLLSPLSYMSYGWGASTSYNIDGGQKEGVVYWKIAYRLYGTSATEVTFRIQWARYV